MSSSDRQFCIIMQLKADYVILVNLLGLLLRPILRSSFLRTCSRVTSLCILERVFGATWCSKIGKFTVLISKNRFDYFKVFPAHSRWCLNITTEVNAPLGLISLRKIGISLEAGHNVFVSVLVHKNLLLLIRIHCVISFPHRSA